MIDSSIYWRHLNAVPQSPKSQTLAGLVGAYDQAQQRNQNAELMQMKRDEIQRKQQAAQAAAEEAARIKRLQQQQTSLMQSVSPQSSPQGPYRQGLQQPTMQEVMPQIAALDMALGDKGKGIASLGEMVKTQAALNPQPKYGAIFDGVGPDGKPTKFRMNETTGIPEPLGVAPLKKDPLAVVNNGNKSVLGEIGPLIKEERIKTQGAMKALDAADQIEAAVRTGQVNAGPGANQIQTVNQLLVAYAGKNPESIRATRQVIKNLAVLALEARKQLQGQGQVTENEAAAVARAEAGEINELTVPELLDLVNLTRKANAPQVENWGRVYGQLEQDQPNAAKYFQIPGYNKIKNNDIINNPIQRTVVRTGKTKDGRAVKQYSDGTVEYAD